MVTENPILIEWLINLFKDAIEESTGTIRNERIWMNGSDTDEEIKMHIENINLQEEYITLLEKYIDDLNQYKKQTMIIR